MRIIAVLIVLLSFLPVVQAQPPQRVVLISQEFNGVPGYTFVDTGVFVSGSPENIEISSSNGTLILETSEANAARFLHLMPLYPAGRALIDIGLGISPGSDPLLLMLLGPEDLDPHRGTFVSVVLSVYNYPKSSNNTYLKAIDPASGAWIFCGRLRTYGSADGVELKSLQVEMDSGRNLVLLKSMNSLLATIPYTAMGSGLPGPSSIYLVSGRDSEGRYLVDFVRQEVPKGEELTILPSPARFGLAVVVNDGSSRDVWGARRIGMNFSLFVQLGAGSQAEAVRSMGPEGLFLYASPAELNETEAQSILSSQVNEFYDRYGRLPSSILTYGRMNLTLSSFLESRFGTYSLRQGSRRWMLVSNKTLDLVLRLLSSGEILNVYMFVPMNGTDSGFDPNFRLTWKDLERLSFVFSPAYEVCMEDLSSSSGQFVVIKENPLTFQLLGPAERFSILLSTPSGNPVLVSPCGGEKYLPEGNGVFRVGRGIYVVDLLPPSLEILSPSPGDVVNSTLLPVRLEYWDDTGIREILIAVDGEIVARYGAGQSVYVPLGEGTHILTVVVVDLAGRSAGRNVTVTVDTVPPSISGVPSAVASPFVNFSVEVHDPSGIKAVRWRLDGGPWNLGRNVSIGPLGQGLHELDVEAEDGAGNWAFRSFEINVDFQGPRVEIVYPEDGERLRSPVPVVWRGDAVRYEVLVDGEEVEAYNGVILDLPPGEHEILVRGWDPLGNENSDTVKIYVYTPKTPYVLASLITIILALLLLRIKR